jgi:beta-phosphoglucomutase-like phosphatase (HAD superfamily)
VSRFPHIRAVICDNDDTAQAFNPRKGYGSPEAQWLAAFNAVLTSLGIAPLTEDSPVRQKMKGIDIRDVWRIQHEELGMPLSYEEWRRVLDPVLLALAPLGEIAEGFDRFVTRLDERDILVGIASSALTLILEAKWKRFSTIKMQMNCFLAGDDKRVKRSKPEPDLLLAAAADIGVTPDKCAYVGDSRSDIRAALAAGMLPILYNQKGVLLEGLPSDTIVVSSFDELADMF